MWSYSPGSAALLFEGAIFNFLNSTLQTNKKRALCRSTQSLSLWYIRTFNTLWFVGPQTTKKTWCIQALSTLSKYSKQCDEDMTREEVLE